MAFGDQFELMANYNQWINDKIYTAANELGTELASRNMGALFGSILGTLNHIMVADVIWLEIGPWYGLFRVDSQGGLPKYSLSRERTRAC